MEHRSRVREAGAFVDAGGVVVAGREQNLEPSRRERLLDPRKARLDELESLVRAASLWSTRDANFEFRYKQQLSFFVNARNLTNVAQDIQRYAPVVTPSWSRTYRREEFGVQYTVGFKGSF